MRNRQNMPQAREDRPAFRMQWEIAPRALDRWTPDLMAAATDNTISVLDPIGYDPWTGEGVTAKRIAAALRTIGPDKDITVSINSPGGDMFEGLAIYNLLREHEGTVTVKVLGMAASAASIIAMAADELLVARAGFLMIHDCWAVVVGNRLDLLEMAETLKPFDAAMADIYAARSGLDPKAVQKMMDAETWIGGAAAVEQGFADGLLPADDVKKNVEAKDRSASYRLEAALMQAGLPRAERRQLIQDFKSSMQDAAGAGMPGATDDGKPGAAVDPSELLAAMRQFNIKEE